MSFYLAYTSSRVIKMMIVGTPRSGLMGRTRLNHQWYALHVVRRYKICAGTYWCKCWYGIPYRSSEYEIAERRLHQYGTRLNLTMGCTVIYWLPQYMMTPVWDYQYHHTLLDDVYCRMIMFTAVVVRCVTTDIFFMITLLFWRAITMTISIHTKHFN